MGKINIMVGDITNDELLKNHDCIVNPTNPRMVCGGGVSQAIFQKAGINQLENYTQNKYNISYFNEDNLMKVGEVRITPGFNLGIDILFAQGPKAYDYLDTKIAKSLLLNTYNNLINIAYNNGYKNILCPSLGTGSYYFKHSDIAKLVISTINNNIKAKDLNITLVIFNPEDKKYYE